MVAGNVANANTPGYVEESVNQVEIATADQSGASVDVTGINRDLNTLLQNQLWTETSGDSYADTAAQIYQQLQQIYGTPGSSTSFDAIFNNFTSTLQALSRSPSSYSSQTAVISAAQKVAQNLNSMTATIQQLRSKAQQGIATGVQSVNTALQQIAQINRAARNGSDPTLLRPTWRTSATRTSPSSSQLMNVQVVQNANNQVSIFTSTGQQLVAGNASLATSFDNDGTLSATSLWSANPSQDSAGTITLVVAVRYQHRPDRHQCDPVRPDRRLSAVARLRSCRRHRASSTNSPIRCRRRCPTRRQAAPR